MKGWTKLLFVYTMSSLCTHRLEPVYYQARRQCDSNYQNGKLSGRECLFHLNISLLFSERQVWNTLTTLGC
jgi:hypothetical protein